ncbi:MAG: hypothetical protein JW809_17110 [Pirellulales bacterium]|nr:hypothetical protein [Pirellulales bacterium]
MEHLRVPLVVVLGHEKCGAVTAALAPEKPTGNLGRLISDIDTGESTGTDDDALSSAVRHNARTQADRMTSRSALLKMRREEEKVKFVTGIYHLDNGKVEWLAE